MFNHLYITRVFINVNGNLQSSALSTSFSTLKAEEFSCSGNERQCEHGDDHFPDCAHGKRPQSLFSHLAEVGAQTNTGEGEKESPPRKIRKGRRLLLGEEVVGSQNGNQQQAEHELREF